MNKGLIQAFLRRPDITLLCSINRKLVMDKCEEAAAYITELEAENERLRSALEQVRENLLVHEELKGGPHERNSEEIPEVRLIDAALTEPT